ncbi:hypothetical protein [Parasedimentitalea maritima]|uniref:Uncharacterized protein n=1 Tax=Parasedimentitalea maritima TaxID=2578117 RepID=A0A6A4RAX8_9RHOB|nr:hypothetical protein [Zongyanglinia marina]KAE9625495.1 hypothetical protein GP644_22525 [Zongyanglinia marina]
MKKKGRASKKIERKTVVHFVHGTWPYGPHRRSSPVNKTAWFEDGSEVRKSIENKVEGDVAYTSFSWSGKNSFKAREKAVLELKKHFIEIKSKYPKSKHIFVSHSHGGTICTDFLKFNNQKDLKAVVCLSTPFAYLMKPWGGNDSHGTIFSVALTSVAIAVFYYFFGLNLLEQYNAIIVGICTFLISILLSTALHFGTNSTRALYTGYGIQDPPPILIIRATRDEAALITGFVQSINQLAKSAFEATEGYNDGIFLRVASYACFIIFGYYLVLTIFEKAVLDELGTFSELLLFAVFGPASAGALYLTSYSIVALSTGLTSFPLWFHHTVEVDAAPLETPVALKSYSDLEGLTRSSLRHGIYDMPEVQADIASVINAVVRKKKPKFLTNYQARK